MIFLGVVAFFSAIFGVVLLILTIKENNEFSKVKQGNFVDETYGKVKSYFISTNSDSHEVTGVIYTVSCKIDGTLYDNMEAFRIIKKYFMFYPVNCGDIVNKTMPIKYFFKNNKMEVYIYEEDKTNNQIIRNYVISFSSIILGIISFIISFSTLMS